MTTLSKGIDQAAIHLPGLEPGALQNASETNYFSAATLSATTNSNSTCVSVPL